jgi:hypothetical protein
VPCLAAIFFIFCCAGKKKQILNYSETLRQKTLFVSSPTGVELPHSHGMAAAENYKVFFMGCRDAAGRETV